MSSLSRSLYVAVMVMSGCLLTSCRLQRLIMESPTVVEEQPKSKSTFRLTDGESQALKGIMVKALKDQRKPPEEVRGIFECQNKASQKKCFLRTRVPGTEKTTKRRELKEKMTKRVYEYIQKYQRRLRYEPFIVVEIICTDSGSIKICHLSHPRMANELIIDKATSIEIAGILKGNRPFQNGEVVRGTLLCQWQFSKAGKNCVLRSMFKGVLSNVYHKMPRTMSQKISEDLKFLVRYFFYFQKDNAKKTFDPPPEILTQISCTVDLASSDSSSHENTLCKAVI